MPPVMYLFLHISVLRQSGTLRLLNVGNSEVLSRYESTQTQSGG
jgi:hypothetical protein